MVQRLQATSKASRPQARSMERQFGSAPGCSASIGACAAWVSARWRGCLRCDVRQLALCAALRESDLPHLEAIVSAVRISPGQMLFGEGEPVRYAYNVVAGTLRLFKMLPDGRRQITGLGTAGDFLGLSSGGTHPYGAEAVDDVTLCQLPIRRLHELFLRFPDLETRLLDMRNAELVAAQERMALLGRKAPVEKIATFLLEFSVRQEQQGRPASPVFLPLTRGDIADYLGLTVETVSRCFTRLKEDRLIALPAPTSVEMIDPKRLTEVAAGGND